MVVEAGGAGCPDRAGRGGGAAEVEGEGDGADEAPDCPSESVRYPPLTPPEGHCGGLRPGSVTSAALQLAPAHHTASTVRLLPSPFNPLRPPESSPGC